MVSLSACFVSSTKSTNITEILDLEVSNYFQGVGKPEKGTLFSVINEEEQSFFEFCFFWLTRGKGNTFSTNFIQKPMEEFWSTPGVQYFIDTTLKIFTHPRRKIFSHKKTRSQIEENYNYIIVNKQIITSSSHVPLGDGRRKRPFLLTSANNNSQYYVY